MFAAMREVGAALIATHGTFERPKPKPKIDPLLAALDLSPAIRRCVGRIDVSGQTAGAKVFARCATIEGVKRLELFYRGGRDDQIRDLATVAQTVARDNGWGAPPWRFTPEQPTIWHSGKDGSGTWAASMVLYPQGAAAQKLRLSTRRSAPATLAL